MNSKDPSERLLNRCRLSPAGPEERDHWNEESIERLLVNAEVLRCTRFLASYSPIFTSSKAIFKPLKSPDPVNRSRLAMVPKRHQDGRLTSVWPRFNYDKTTQHRPWFAAFSMPVVPNALDRPHAIPFTFDCMFRRDPCDRLLRFLSRSHRASAGARKRDDFRTRRNLQASQMALHRSVSWGSFGLCVGNSRESADLLDGYHRRWRMENG